MCGKLQDNMSRLGKEKSHHQKGGLILCTPLGIENVSKMGQRDFSFKYCLGGGMFKDDSGPRKIKPEDVIIAPS